MAKHLTNPAKEAFNLAMKMKKFRAMTEETARNEFNPNVDSERAEVVRQIDWNAFNEVVKQLQFVYMN